ncbi:hypothetical protein, partial [Listeria monocytogenes]
KNEYSIREFILCTSEIFDNENIFFDSFEDIFKKISLSKNKSTALISKVKEIYKDDFEKFEKDCMYIQENFVKLDKFAVEDKINEKYGQLLFQTKNNPQLYELRLEELFKYIQFDLLDVIGQRKPYLCGLNRFHTYLENVIQRIN